MAHEVERVWFHHPVPSPDPQSANELRSWMVTKSEGRPQLPGSSMDSIVVVGDEVVLTCREQSRSVPLSNVSAYEPPRPQRGRPKQGKSG